MTPFDVPQTLILAPQTPFAEVRDTLAEMGFTQADTGTVTPPLIDGEPELANWTWYGELPLVQYSFNAVVRLRILDVATVPPEMRADIAERLGAMPPEAVRAALRSDDERRRLWAVWAAVETERIDLVHDITAARDTAAGIVREELDTALYRLGDMAEARFEMLATGRVIATSAIDLIGRLGDAAALARLMPTEADCAAAFHHTVADGVWQALRTRAPPTEGIRAQPRSTDDITALPAGALRWPNELSDKVARGWRIVAGWLEPSVVWLSWQGTEPDGGRRLMDGLVFVNDRWVWMPKAFRVVEPLTMQVPAPRGAVRH